MIRIASARSQMVTARAANGRNHGSSEARLAASTMLPQFIPAPFSLFSFALKHSERLREPDTEEVPVNSGFLASLPKN
jgi:hypothetical protein